MESVYIEASVTSGSASRHGPEAARQRHHDARRVRAYIQRSKRVGCGAGRRARRQRDDDPPLARPHHGQRPLAHGRRRRKLAYRHWKRCWSASCEPSSQLPLDDITEVMRRCVNAELSRSAIHRCLRAPRPQPSRPSLTSPPSASSSRPTVGFIHVDLKHLPALERRKSYAFVAIDRATRYVYLEIHPKRDAKTAAGFLERFLARLPVSRPHHPHRQRQPSSPTASPST